MLVVPALSLVLLTLDAFCRPGNKVDRVRAGRLLKKCDWNRWVLPVRIDHPAGNGDTGLNISKRRWRQGH